MDGRSRDGDVTDGATGSGATMMGRAGFRLTPDGRHAACLASDRHGTVHLERWTLTAGGPRLTARHPAPGATDAVAPVRAGGLLCSSWRAGRQVLTVHGAGGPVAVRDLASAVLGGGGTPERPVRLIGARPDGSVLATTGAPDGTVRVLSIDPDRLTVDVVAGVPGPLSHTLPLGNRTVLVVRSRGGAETLLLDPDRGTVRPAVAPVAGPALPLATAAGRVLYGVRAPGGHRLVIADPDDPDDPGTVLNLSGPGGTGGRALPLALSPDLREVVLRVARGARSTLVAYPVAGGGWRRLDLPDGRTAPVAGWGDRGLWLPHSTPDRPTTWWWRPPGATSLRPATGSRLPCPPVHVVTVPGAAGKIEAVVYGADWRTTGRLVVALHGGPADHWDLGFDDVLRRLATAGLTVLAVNQRGSSGYGRAHEYAIDGAWGGPDLDDVLATADHLRAVRGDGRPPPALFGVSYGAYLALLALARHPGRWSACVAVAPFLSGARLREDGGPGVRALVDRLHGAVVLDDGHGPRDLLRVAHRMRGRVLLVHGAADTVVPVSHSRELVEALRGVRGVDVTYREVRGTGHHVLLSDASLVAEACAVLAGRVGTTPDAGFEPSGAPVIRAGGSEPRLVPACGPRGEGR